MDNLQSEIEKAAKVVLEGGVILYPTDTIWGLGCDATNKTAVEKINRIKGRSADKGYILLINGAIDFSGYLNDPSNFDPLFHRQFGKPVTVIYRGARNLAPDTLALNGSVAVRIVNDKFCASLISTVGVPLVSTSANVSGAKAPARFMEISGFLKSRVEHVVDLRQAENKIFSASMLVRKTGRSSFEVLRE